MPDPLVKRKIDTADERGFTQMKNELAFHRKTVGSYLESLGARTDTPPPIATVQVW